MIILNMNLTSEQINWCKEHFGEPNWKFNTTNNKTVCFRPAWTLQNGKISFNNKEDAAFFKLRWLYDCT